MNRFEQIEERSEVVFTSKQLVFMSVGIVIIVLASFLLGFSMGKKTQNKKNRLGAANNNDLLARLDKLEEESKSFRAKRALTVLRKREINVDTELDVNTVKPLSSGVISKKRVRKIRGKRVVRRNALALSRKGKRTVSRRFTRKSRKVSRKFAKRTNRRKVSGIRGTFARKSFVRNKKRSRKVYAFGKRKNSSSKRASLR